MTKVHSHKLKKLALKFVEHSVVAFLLSVGYTIHLVLEAKRRLERLSFHQVIIDGADFHEDEISLWKFVWLTCNLVPLRGLYQPLQRIERGLYVVEGRLNRVSFESNFLNRINSEDL